MLFRSQVPLNGAVSNSIQLTTDGNGTLISSSAQLATSISGSWIGAVSSSAQLSTDISGSWQGWASSSTPHTFGGDLRVSGDIIAENYIVSSSVTYMTQSFSSGSTIFGDSPDDTHVFTGSLTVSGSTGLDVQHGNISGSATSTGSFGRIEATTISASVVNVDAATLNVGNQTINQTIAGNIQNISPALISGSWNGAVSASAQLVTSGTNAILSSSAQLATAISGSFTAPSSSLASRITTAEAELGNTLISSSAQLATAISEIGRAHV